MKEFNFVIAKPWKLRGKSLCCYGLHSQQVFFGTIEYAKELRTHIRTKSGKNNYQIYSIDTNFRLLI